MNDDEKDLDTLLTASVALFGLIAKSLAPTLEKVTMQQYRILVLVTTRGPLRSSDLADELGLLPSGVTRMVDRLIRDGFAEKNRGTLSRREVLVSATPAGSTLVAAALDQRRQDLRAFLAGLSASERTLLHHASQVFTPPSLGLSKASSSVLVPEYLT